MAVDPESTSQATASSDMRLLRGAVKDYAWGCSQRIPALMGGAVTSDVIAEVWFGAHPSGPTAVADSQETLAELVAAKPEAMLGDDVRRRFGDRLPYLVKFLAAASPLSLQVHPSLDEARAGFAAEDKAGIARSAPNRSYRDDNHKPEFIAALTDFEALVGFRPALQSADLLGSLQVNGLAPIIAALDVGPGHALRLILEGDPTPFASIVADTASACARARDNDPWKAEKDLISRLAEAYPGDRGVLTAALLNRVVLAPGEGLYLDAGTLHAYVEGLGLEVMASSDNVLRAGLTPKHVDIPELLRVVRPCAAPPAILHARGAVSHMDLPADEFRVSRYEIKSGALHRHVQPGPKIVVCVEGGVELSAPAPMVSTALSISAGQAGWVPPAVGELELQGVGVAWVVGVGNIAD